jgi:hypothetical protein
MISLHHQLHLPLPGGSIIQGQTVARDERSATVSHPQAPRKRRHHVASEYVAGVC